MAGLLPFADRRSAGRLLASQLARLRAEDPIVLALPRGGVPVAFEIACALDAELDLLMVRKIAAPSNPEFAIGAVIDGDEPQLLLDEDVIRSIAADSGYIQKEASRQLIELERRRRAYRGVMRSQPLARRTVIIVDDGIATGATIEAALLAARRHRPSRIILAVPVASSATIARLRALCDEIVVLATPEPFGAVGEHYRDFRQVEDDEVIRLLEAAARQSH